MLRVNQLTGFGAGGGGLRTISALRFEGVNGATTFIDDANPGRTWVSANGASLSDARSIYGTTSLYLAGSDGNGVGDFIYTSDIAPFQVADKDFTIESWVWSNVAPMEIYAACGRATVSDAEYFLYFIQLQNGLGAYDYVQATDNETTWGVSAGGQTSRQPFDGLWHHHAVVRFEDTISHYYDGILRANNPVAMPAGFNISDIDPGNKFLIGAPAFDPHPSFQTSIGYLKNWRFTLGARYLTNFTPGDF